jgi:hypothetical protein
VRTPFEEFPCRRDDKIQFLLEQLDLLESGNMVSRNARRLGYVDTTPKVVLALRRSLSDMQKLEAEHLRQRS